MRATTFAFVLLCALLTCARSAAATELTAADLEAWLDGFLPYAMEKGDVAGGVVVVVKDGQALLQKGYGYADVEKRKPVDAERTLFRAGSVAKVFTDTAVMQQVERGKLDLDTEVDQYIDFKIPEAFGKAPTLHNLVTHSGGFEERTRYLMTSDPKLLVSIESYVKNLNPTRIFPPGEVPSYCNYCLTLAGYVVQRTSGEKFDDYLDRHIFAPLGMTRTTFRQPLPKALQADMSMGYEVASEPAQYFELVGPAPAGSIATTGADMARFMVATLNGERGGEPSLLNPQTAHLMYTRMFRAAPPTNGMAVGFFERSRNGRRIIGHGGDTQFFHSDLLLFLDDNVGLFMSFNSSGKEGAVYSIRDALFDQFADRYFPQTLPPEPTTATALAHGREVSGTYASSRRAESTFLATVGLLSQTQIAMNEDGTLEIPALTELNGKPKKWREVGNYLWREVGGTERIAARMDSGRVRFIGLDSAGGIEVLMPVPAWKSSAWIKPAAIVALAALLLTVAFWPVSALVRRNYAVAFPLTGQRALGYRAVRVAALISLVFVVGWSFLIQTAFADLASFDGRLDFVFGLMNLAGVLGVVAAAVAVWNAWLTFRSGASWYSKAWNVVLALSCVLIAWVGIVFHLTRFSISY